MRRCSGRHGQGQRPYDHGSRERLYGLGRVRGGSAYAQIFQTYRNGRHVGNSLCDPSRFLWWQTGVQGRAHGGHRLAIQDTVHVFRRYSPDHRAYGSMHCGRGLYSCPLRFSDHQQELRQYVVGRSPADPGRHIGSHRQERWGRGLPYGVQWKL